MQQVTKSHYEFQKYLGKARWTSIWHQIDEVTKLKPTNVLEIGPGPGIFKTVLNHLDIQTKTLDHSAELAPDYVGSATAIPLQDNAFDVVCAFQVLEHLQYKESLIAFREMVRVCSRNVIISLPDTKPVWRYFITIPKLGGFNVSIPRPMHKAKEHTFDGEHYWEINKKGYELQQVVSDLSTFCRLKSTYRVPENPYHRFFLFEK